MCSQLFNKTVQLREIEAIRPPESDRDEISIRFENIVIGSQPSLALRDADSFDSKMIVHAKKGDTADQVVHDSQ